MKEELEKKVKEKNEFNEYTLIKTETIPVFYERIPELFFLIFKKENNKKEQEFLLELVSYNDKLELNKITIKEIYDLCCFYYQDNYKNEVFLKILRQIKVSEVHLGYDMAKSIIIKDDVLSFVLNENTKEYRYVKEELMKNSLLKLNDLHSFLVKITENHLYDNKDCLNKVYERKLYGRTWKFILNDLYSYFSNIYKLKEILIGEVRNLDLESYKEKDIIELIDLYSQDKYSFVKNGNNLKNGYIIDCQKKVEELLSCEDENLVFKEDKEEIKRNSNIIFIERKFDDIIL
jgi:hypothetical protein